MCAKYVSRIQDLEHRPETTQYFEIIVYALPKYVKRVGRAISYGWKTVNLERQIITVVKFYGKNGVWDDKLDKKKWMFYSKIGCRKINDWGDKIKIEYWMIKWSLIWLIFIYTIDFMNKKLSRILFFQCIY